MLREAGLAMSVAPYILKRLTQSHERPAEVPQSTPVLGFGRFLTASVATLGLNPSRREFCAYRSTQLLPEARRRLATLSSLGLASYAEAGTNEHQATLDACLDYFLTKTRMRGFESSRPFLNVWVCRTTRAQHVTWTCFKPQPIRSGVNCSVTIRIII